MQNQKKTSTKKKVTSTVAVVLALVIALGGTFAWQSISQQARNEAETFKNPGGRLHDDFSGWQTSSYNNGTLTKDIYVENFGSQTIYARVRLDEYMEIGTGAGIMPDEDGWATKTVQKMHAGSEIDDVTTWKTHLPVEAVAADPTASPAVTAAPANLGNNPNEGLTGMPGHTSFHEYWNWVMGGENTSTAAQSPYSNEDGTTIYMPTFNKNGDSLAADINGTMEGKVEGDKSQYDDWIKYTEYVPPVYDTDNTTIKTAASGDSATRVRNTTKSDANNYDVPDGAFVDADDNTDSEGDVNDPDNGMYGNGGTEGSNYTVVEETHYAKKTLPGGVVTMYDYWNTLNASQRSAHGWWVYDVDGWAYWSQGIAPNTATGVLLDQLLPNPALTSLTDEWYYSINAVAQFITADDLGRDDGTGFFYTSKDGAPTGFSKPTDDAMTLLKSMGVDTDVHVDLVLHTQNSAGDEVGYMDGYVVPSGDYYLSADFMVEGTSYSLTTEDGTDTKLPTITWSVVDKGSSTAALSGTMFDTTTVNNLQIDGGQAKPITVQATITMNAGQADEYKINASRDLACMSTETRVAILASQPGTTKTVNVAGYNWYVLAQTEKDDGAGNMIPDQALLLSEDVMISETWGTDGSSSWVNASDDAFVNMGEQLNKIYENNSTGQPGLDSASEFAGVKIPSTSTMESHLFLLSEADLLGTTNGAEAAAGDYTVHGEDPDTKAAINGVKLTAPGGSWVANGPTLGSDGKVVYEPMNWWLMTPSTISQFMEYVDVEGVIDGAKYDKDYGIRPAGWFDMSGYTAINVTATGTLVGGSSDGDLINDGADTDGFTMDSSKKVEYVITAGLSDSGMEGGWTWTVGESKDSAAPEGVTWAITTSTGGRTNDTITFTADIPSADGGTGKAGAYDVTLTFHGDEGQTYSGTFTVTLNS